MSNQIYNELNVSTFKELLTIVDSPDNKETVAIIIKFGADWCGPCNRIHPYCHAKFKQFDKKIICFDINIEHEDNLELYHAYKQKKMISSVPVIFAYIGNDERNMSYWWAPDLVVNSSSQSELDNFFEKINKLIKIN